MHLWQIQPLRDALVLSAIFGIVYLGYVLSIVTVPILLALMLAYLFEPVVARMTRDGRVGRARVAVSILLLSFFLIIVPAGVGLGVSIVQGVSYVSSVARSIEQLSSSVLKPEDDVLRASLSQRSKTWGVIRDFIVDERAKFVASGDRKVKADAQKSSDAESRNNPVPQQGTETSPADASRNQNPTNPDSNVTDAQDSQNTDDAEQTMGDQPAQGDQDTAEVLGMEIEPSMVFRILEWSRQSLQRNANDIGNTVLTAGGGAVGALFSILNSTWKLLATLFLTAFFFYFFCTGYGKVLQFWKGFVPYRKRGRVLELLEQMDVVISGFIRGRLTICAILIGVYTFGYFIIGVPAPLIVGPIVGLFTLIPYASGALAPIVILLMLLEPSNGWQGAWWWSIGSPLLVLGIAQVLDDYFLTPRIQGKSTNMDMPTILFASIAGGTLAGFYGLLLAIPAAACIKILLREIFWPRFREWAMGRADDLLPISKE